MESRGLCTCVSVGLAVHGKHWTETQSLLFSATVDILWKIPEQADWHSVWALQQQMDRKSYLCMCEYIV